MQIGPIQILVIGFESNDKFTGEIMRELELIRGRSVIRVLDLLFVMKDEVGNITTYQNNDLNDEEELEIGVVISRMMGLKESSQAEHGLEEALLAANYGITQADIVDLSNQIEPGSSAGVLMIEHTWALGLKDAIINAGGRMLSQGFLTRDAMMMIGAELQATAEAETSIEMAEAVKGAALLDVLCTVAKAKEIEEAAIDDATEAIVAAELVKTALSADVIRTLIVANLLEDSAAEEAIIALIEAGLIDPQAAGEAEDTVTQAEKVATEAFAAFRQGDDEESAEQSEQV
ncbi:hypothetical protein QUF63_17840 [Anaerolineales bacterium HSG25]|nr:hypothetical protein [Anaerolineales bacterium HSG25]